MAKSKKLGESQAAPVNLAYIEHNFVEEDMGLLV
jgi:hypothetical protein